MQHFALAVRSSLAPGLACAALVAIGCGEPEATDPLAPGAAEGHNLIVVTLDTTRPDYVSPFGADPEVTPHLAELARRSWVFRNAYSETNITNPSHLTILSGRRAIDHGVLTNDAPVPEDVTTLPEVFRRAGYATAGFPAAPHVGPQMGWRGFDLLPDPPAPAVEAPDVVALANRWLRERADERFFAWVHFFDPHALYEPPEEIAERFYPGDPAAGDGAPLADHRYFEDLGELGEVFTKWLGDVRDLEYPRAMYAAELHYADRAIERLLATVEEAGVSERTVIVVLADHGESLDEHGIFYDHKGLYEPQLRIPLMVHVPGIEPGASDAFVTTLDVAPTIAELFALDLGGEDLAGRSLLPLMRGAHAPTVPEFFVHQNAHNHVVAVRERHWKLLVPINKDHPVLARGIELFDLFRDPGELKNLADEEPERVQAMLERARPWIRMGLHLAGNRTHLSDEARERLRTLGYE